MNAFATVFRTASEGMWLWGPGTGTWPDVAGFHPALDMALISTKRSLCPDHAPMALMSG